MKQTNDLINKFKKNFLSTNWVKFQYMYTTGNRTSVICQSSLFAIV